MKFRRTVVIFLSSCLLAALQASFIDVAIHFSNESFSVDWMENKIEDRLFGINYYTCLQTIGTPECPGAQATFQAEYWVRKSDQTGDNVWSKRLDLGSAWTGPVVFDIFAPLDFRPDRNGDFIFSSSVTACFDDLADVEMSLEICDQHGSPWTVFINDTAETVTLDVYPAFGLGEVGTTSVLLPQFYSPQLNNSRDIPVYIPPSVIQNKEQRPINIMFVLDGSESVVESYATRTGFEASQQMGDVPESIMIGISTVEWAYKMDFSQRTYELTYEVGMEYPTESCMYAGDDPSGGSPLLLQWLDEDVIDAVLAKIGVYGVGMLRGEVSITGGSMGGLTSCYAAAARPDVFKRAVCSSPMNCFNFKNGGLATVIADTYDKMGILPHAVMQFLGQEVYDEDKKTQGGDERQLEYLAKDERAWLAIGMATMTSETAFQPVDISSGVTQAYTTLAPTPPHVVMSMLLPGGQHSPSTWEQEFAAALPNLYRPSRPDPFRVPKSESLKLLVAKSLP